MLRNATLEDSEKLMKFKSAEEFLLLTQTHSKTDIRLRLAKLGLYLEDVSQASIEVKQKPVEKINAYIAKAKKEAVTRRGEEKNLLDVNPKLTALLSSVRLPLLKSDNAKLAHATLGFFAPKSPQERQAARQRQQDSIDESKQIAKRHWAENQANLCAELREKVQVQHALLGSQGLLRQLPTTLADMTVGYYMGPKFD